MPPAKKAAKKAATDPIGHDGKDLRRAFEHSSRVDILQRLLPPAATGPIATLISLACNQLEPGRNEAAAHLLRASEHLSFASLAPAGADDSPLAPELERAIHKQFQDLTRRADEQWQDRPEHTELVAAIYESSRISALRAFENAAWYRALEFARAAEALAQVDASGSDGRGPSRAPRQLERGKTSLKLVAPR